ncbi:MAG: hypothetical protein RBS76_00070 [Acholeplasmatales bacterium]|jgi:hypothetical protein|nr:hypothetical protein [Acholeplasmataceae bacterium]MDY0114876.1 hypothetical protein [Acholeplasmatales bacterium]MCK9234108.1 hypothetical protein [Acholeplasmataceae bacterium]MCK9288738.1 hypothetical protein [Acholeplasmataceae bacterium]MCK9427356.1 hypothetical protein [Acholeplasmataceae bacterium]
MVIDYLILAFVLVLVALIVYFRFIKKGSTGTCNCYKAKTCGLKLNELKDLFKENNLNN